MATVKRPDPLRMPKVDDKFTLAVIEGKIKDFVNYVKTACNGAGKDRENARNRAKFLVRDLMELKKEKVLSTRVSAVELLYKNFNEWVKDLPEEAEEKEGLKNGDHPRKVIITGNKKCPSGCPSDYHDTLLKAMAKTANYAYSKSNNSWTPDFGKQTGHADGKGWKAYVDAADGKGTRWRLGFTMSFEEVDEELTVSINYCKEGH